MSQHINKALVTVLFATASLLGCKAKPLASDLNAIVSVDDDGVEKALGFVEIRNVMAGLTDSEADAVLNTKGISQLFKAPFLALVECVGNDGTDPATVLRQLEQLAGKHAVFVSPRRDLVLPAANKSLSSSCKVVPGRFATFAIVDYFLNSVDSFGSEKAPAGLTGLEVEKRFLTAQAFHLALRGTYYPQHRHLKVHSNIETLRAMGMMEFGQQMATGDVLAQRIGQMDPNFVPCFSGSGGKKLIGAPAQAWMKRNFTCVPSADGGFDFKPGTTGGLRYSVLRQMLMASIENAYESLYTPLLVVGPKANAGVWDALTYAGPWENLAGNTLKIAKLMDIGNGSQLTAKSHGLNLQGEEQDTSTNFGDGGDFSETDLDASPTSDGLVASDNNAGCDGGSQSGLGLADLPPVCNVVLGGLINKLSGNNYDWSKNPKALNGAVQDLQNSPIGSTLSQFELKRAQDAFAVTRDSISVMTGDQAKAFLADPKNASLFATVPDALPSGSIPSYLSPERRLDYVASQMKDVSPEQAKALATHISNRINDDFVVGQGISGLNAAEMAVKNLDKLPANPLNKYEAITQSTAAAYGMLDVYSKATPTQQSNMAYQAGVSKADFEKKIYDNYYSLKDSQLEAAKAGLAHQQALDQDTTPKLVPAGAPVMGHPKPLGTSGAVILNGVTSPGAADDTIEKGTKSINWAFRTAGYSGAVSENLVRLGSAAGAQITDPTAIWQVNDYNHAKSVLQSQYFSARDAYYKSNAPAERQQYEAEEALRQLNRSKRITEMQRTLAQGRTVTSN